MARVRVPITVVDLSGNAVTGAAVRIRDRATLIDTTVYTAETGPATETNPVFTTSQGIAPGWVDRGAYRADISGTGITSYQVPFDALAAADDATDAELLAVETALDARLDFLEAGRLIEMGEKVGTSNTTGLGGAWQGIGILRTITGLVVGDVIELQANLRVDCPSGSTTHAWFHVTPAATTPNSWRLLPGVNTAAFAANQPMLARYVVVNAGSHNVSIMAEGTGAAAVAYGANTHMWWKVLRGLVSPVVIAPSANAVAAI